MKRIATIQDISCVGKCSLTVALPIISAMGIETAILPTAVLSTHTAFSGFTFRDLTDDIPGIAAHWKKENFTFDALYTGYLGSKRQISLVKSLFRDFGSSASSSSSISGAAVSAATSANSAPSALSAQALKFVDPAICDTMPSNTHCASAQALKFVDPAMADSGALYAGFTPDFAQEMASLCAEADVIVPNLTEACLMTGTPYREDYDEAFAMELLQKLAAQKRQSCSSAQNAAAAVPASDVSPSGYIILTGAHRTDSDLGALGYDIARDRFFSYYGERLPVKFHGTGDIFASCTVGALARGLSIEKAIRIAVDYTHECIRLTMKDSDHRWYGVNFESAIPYLLKLLDQ
ncbi:MAG: bifunctional hydroxymethylpyrimidine kinase/phosphomethylpyrimidine kinase [Eubacteriales bacterium]|nr:bifunctional hydroxymethylpyrimidine kinase/phosphomethylpyrimidine kinase [Eubacteriales bacterium]